MCQGYLFTHVECNHFQKFVNIIHCPQVNEANECGANNLQVIDTVLVHVPSLCNSCFWRKERSIAKTYDAKIDKAESRIADLRWKKRAEMDIGVRREMNGEMSRLALVLDDLRDEKSEEIGGLHSLHAWADGREVIRDKH